MAISDQVYRAMNQRSNLVVVCAGDASMHTRYAEAHRNFDLCVAYFGDQADRYRDQCEHYLPRKGLQMELLATVFREMPELIEQYDRFWLPDDDLVTNTDDVNRLFDLFADSNFYIAQPSLTPDSDASISMLTCKQLGSCGIDFVEVMCPLFTRDSLRHSIPWLEESATGWGVDEIWSVHALERGKKLGIFDQVQVGHYRPVGTAGWYQTLEMDPNEELDQLKKRHGLENRIKRRLHPDSDLAYKVEKDRLPQNSPVIVAGLPGSGIRRVAELLLRSNRMYLDLDSQSHDEGAFESCCMGMEEQGGGLAETGLIRSLLQATGSPDYSMAEVPAGLQEELRARGRTMQQMLAERAGSDHAMKHILRQLGERWYHRLHWGWQHPANLYFLPLWQELFGRFRLIHIVRDPRAPISDGLSAQLGRYDPQLAGSANVAQELFEQFWAKINLGVFQWSSREMPRDYLLLRAEDLAGQDEHARRETSRLLNFVGLDFADRSKTDGVFQPLDEVKPSHRSGRVAEALITFGYPPG